MAVRRARMLLFNTHFSACKLIIPFFSWRIFLKTSFISALMFAVNLLFFSSVHCFLVYLRLVNLIFVLANLLMTYQRFEKRKKYEWLVLSFCFVSFVLSVTVFVHNGLKKSLILQTKPNIFLQIPFLHMIHFKIASCGIVGLG